MSTLSIVWSDMTGIRRTCGWRTALGWGVCIARRARACFSARNLQAADRLMGHGPFPVRRGAARAALLGEQVFSGLREIWVRDVYLKDDFLQIEPNSVVMDLGANLGNFSLLALAHPGVQLIAVEPSRALSGSLRRAVAFNGWLPRLRLERLFVGEMTDVQKSCLARDPEYTGVPCVPEAALLRLTGVDRIDFLKCDIEGSEFFMMRPESRLLSMTRQIAVEIHPWGGSVDAFLAMLRNAGFVIGPRKYDPSGGCIVLAKRPG